MFLVNFRPTEGAGCGGGLFQCRCARLAEAMTCLYCESCSVVSSMLVLPHASVRMVRNGRESRQMVHLYLFFQESLDGMVIQ